MNTHLTAFSKRTCHLLFCILMIFSLLRIPSLAEPYWYGDEGVYQVLGRGILDGRVLYSQIWDNKPPLLYLLYAMVGSDQFLIRLLSLFFGLAAVVAFFYLAKKLLTKDTLALPATFLFAILFSIPSTEANIANAENFMLPVIIIAGFFVYTTNQNTSLRIFNKNLFIAGLLLGTAFLIKIVAIFDLAAFFCFLALTKETKQHNVVAFVKTTFVSFFPLLLGFAIPFLLSVVVFLFNGGFLDYMKAAFFSNVSYVGYHNTFIIPQGLLITKLLLLIIAVSFLFKKRNVLRPEVLFILIWTAFSVFNLFFSQRPYTHYMLVTIPSIVLLGVLSLSNLRKYLLLFVIFIVLSFVIGKTYARYNPAGLVRYYATFTSFLTGKTSYPSYLASFDPNVPRDYDIAYFLKSHTKKGETVFIWGNSPQIYTLSHTLPPGRYTVAYHINSEEALLETQQAIDTKKPRFFVILPNTPLPQLLFPSYLQRATISNVLIYERAL